MLDSAEKMILDYAVKTRGIKTPETESISLKPLAETKAKMPKEESLTKRLSILAVVFFKHAHQVMEQATVKLTSSVTENVTATGGNQIPPTPN